MGKKWIGWVLICTLIVGISAFGVIKSLDDLAKREEEKRVNEYENIVKNAVKDFSDEVSSLTHSMVENKDNAEAVLKDLQTLNDKAGQLSTELSELYVPEHYTEPNNKLIKALNNLCNTFEKIKSVTTKLATVPGANTDNGILDEYKQLRYEWQNDIRDVNEVLNEFRDLYNELHNS